MQIRNVKWAGTDWPHVTFEINGRPAKADLDQKWAILAKGFVLLRFTDGRGSDLDEVTIPGDDEHPDLTTREAIYSPWLVKQLERALDAFDDGIWRAGEVVGDGPNE